MERVSTSSPARSWTTGSSVVDVIAGAVGEHGVHEVRLDLRWHRALTRITASIATRRLVLEVPPDLAVESGDVRVDQERGRRRRAHIATGVHVHTVLGLDPADLGYRHSRTLPQRLAPAAAPTPTRRSRPARRHSVAMGTPRKAHEQRRRAATKAPARRLR